MSVSPSMYCQIFVGWLKHPFKAPTLDKRPWYFLFTDLNNVLIFVKFQQEFIPNFVANQFAPDTPKTKLDTKANASKRSEIKWISAGGSAEIFLIQQRLKLTPWCKRLAPHRAWLQWSCHFQIGRREYRCHFPQTWRRCMVHLPETLDSILLLFTCPDAARLWICAKISFKAANVACWGLTVGEGTGAQCNENQQGEHSDGCVNCFHKNLVETILCCWPVSQKPQDGK